MKSKNSGNGAKRHSHQNLAKPRKEERWGATKWYPHPHLMQFLVAKNNKNKLEVEQGTCATIDKIEILKNGGLRLTVSGEDGWITSVAYKDICEIRKDWEIYDTLEGALLGTAACGKGSWLREMLERLFWLDDGK